ncbi:MAG: TRAP transporter large permease subunit [Syntrophales bacterium]|jgi:tripartite ATP-independent transporter DctM subunit|nr:TRAP transporter large permease subunit [Syntrophales bacterium]
MIEPNIIAVIVIASLILLLFMGVPIFAALGLSGVVGIFILKGPDGLQAIPTVMFDKLNSFVLVAVPLFIMMGQVIFFSGMGKDLYTLGSRWLSRLPGGLAMGSVAACTIFGAMCGVSVAGAATIGSFAIPEMLKRGYDKRLATGSVAAAGALALLIPPSVGFIIYGEIADVSVGMLFIGGIVPGLLLAFMMCLYIGILASLRPEVAPPVKETVTWKLRWMSLGQVWPGLLLIFAVLGTIYLGIATPTQAAAIGFVVSLFIAHFVYGSLNRRSFVTVARTTMLTTGMILIIFVCAMFFGYVLTLLKLPDHIMEFIGAAGWPSWLTLTVIMGMLIVLGCFVDAVSVITISAPLLLPTIELMGYSPLWFGIIMGVTLEMAVITPPVGLNLYTIKGIAPPEVSLNDVIFGAIPFVAVEIVGLALLVSFPSISLWLPTATFR